MPSTWTLRRRGHRQGACRQWHTALIILLSDTYQPGTEMEGVALAQSALASDVASWGRSFVSIALMLFAFTSIMYNYYLGENSLNFFSEENKTLFNIYRVITLILVMWEATQDLTIVFGFADLNVDKNAWVIADAAAASAPAMAKQTIT